jgi:C1A family cysteine protease
MIKLFVLIQAIALLPVDGILNQDGAEKTKFQEWKAQYKRIYKTAADEQKASRNLRNNLREIEFHNLRFKAGLETYSRGLWERSDLSFEEKTKVLAAANFNFTQQTLQGPRKKLPSAPQEVNWVKAGLVHPVEDQGSCGSCFAFTAVGTAEGVLLRQGIKTRLSVQQIIDCDRSNEGCEGGDPLLALRFIKSNGMSSADQYPYTDHNGKCKASNGNQVSIASAVRERLSGNERRLREIVANYGPVAVAVNAARSLMNYKSGVYSNPKCPKKVDHAVLLVGFGYDQKTKLDYWLVKNTWVSPKCSLNAIFAP